MPCLVCCHSGALHVADLLSPEHLDRQRNEVENGMQAYLAGRWFESPVQLRQAGDQKWLGIYEGRLISACRQMHSMAVLSDGTMQAPSDMLMIINVLGDLFPTEWPPPGTARARNAAAPHPPPGHMRHRARLARLPSQNAGFAKQHSGSGQSGRLQNTLHLL